MFTSWPFQSTHPRRVRRPPAADDGRPKGDFNPRTHEGCDEISDEVKIQLPISIHAPTKGATNMMANPKATNKISIHAPTKGATFLAPKRVCLIVFQSTHPRRVRRVLLLAVLLVDLNFNPRTHEGCDAAKNLTEAANDGKFQSTHPRRVRPVVCSFVPVLIDFNPRTHEGCDVSYFARNLARSISIHAPTKGATRSPLYIYYLI